MNFVSNKMEDTLSSYCECIQSCIFVFSVKIGYCSLIQVGEIYRFSWLKNRREELNHPVHVYVAVTHFFIKGAKYQNFYALLIINPTSTFPLVTKTKSGLHMLFAIIVRRVFATGRRENVRDNLSESRWFGESRRIT